MKKIVNFELIGNTPQIYFNAEKVTVLSVKTILNMPTAFIMVENDDNLQPLYYNGQTKLSKTIMLQFYITNNGDTLPDNIDSYKYVDVITIEKKNEIRIYHVFVVQYANY